MKKLSIILLCVLCFIPFAKAGDVISEHKSECYMMNNHASIPCDERGLYSSTIDDEEGHPESEKYKYESRLIHGNRLRHEYKFTKEQLLQVIKNAIGKLPKGSTSLYYHDGYSLDDMDEYLTLSVDEPVEVLIIRKQEK